MNKGLYKRIKVALINTSLPDPYYSYGDHWRDGFVDAGCAVTVYPYDMIPNIPQGFDLYFFVEIRYDPWSIPKELHPRVIYSWDSHIVSWQVYEMIAGAFDRVYLASKIDTELFQMKGFNNFEWVPEACNPRVHRNLHKERVNRLGYIGNNDSNYLRNGKTKDEFLERLKIYPYSIVHKKDVYGEAYTEELNKIQIMFDRTIKHNIGTRIFEACASGCLAMWPHAFCDTGIEQLFTMGIHYAPYDDTIDGAESVLHTLFNDSALVERITKGAEEHVLNNHTYAHRVKQILKNLSIDFVEVEGAEKVLVNF